MNKHSDRMNKQTNTRPQAWGFSYLCVITQANLFSPGDRPTYFM
jgi:hypothetical protein